MRQKYLLLFTVIILSISSYGQAPGHVPYSDPEQVELTPANIIIYIVIPILILIIFFYFRHKKKSK